jgi:hypothetical protein
MATIPNWDQLQSMGNRELVEAFNRSSGPNVVGGADFWRNELLRRSITGTNRVLVWLTGIISVATLVNVWLVWRTV